MNNTLIIDEDYCNELRRKEKILDTFEKWLKEHSVIDFNCRDTIIHEQLALNTAYEYLQFLKSNDSEE